MLTCNLFPREGKFLFHLSTPRIEDQKKISERHDINIFVLISYVHERDYVEICTHVQIKGYFKTVIMNDLTLDNIRTKAFVSNIAFFLLRFMLSSAHSVSHWREN